MPQQLPRFHRTQEQIEDERRLARILLETGCSPDELDDKNWKPVNGAGGGEPARMRGLPIIWRGVSGAMPGTDPLRELIRKEDRQRR